MSDLPRRRFLAATATLAATPLAARALAHQPPQAQAAQGARLPEKGKFPVKVVSSRNGLEATRRAYQLITEGTDPLDAVVDGVSIVENDPVDTSVGLGGLPNERGVVQLDAACMHGPTHRAGGVAAIERIKNPAQVALQVLRTTDHVLLVGRDAREFARANGFREENLLTEKARKIWLHWKRTLSDKDDWLVPAGAEADPDVAGFFQSHTQTIAGRPKFVRPTGTIHCSAINADGDMSCVTTTSGLAFKIPGRVGDSPIIGAGLYVDNEYGSCGSTGRGEANLQNLCSFAAVDYMREGMTPEEAGLEVCRLVARHTKRPDLLDEQGRPNFGLNFYLLDKYGRHAGVTLWGPGEFAVTDQNGSRIEPCAFLYEARRPR